MRHGEVVTHRVHNSEIASANLAAATKFRDRSMFNKDNRTRGIPTGISQQSQSSSSRNDEGGLV